jgi:hypothetical protein
MPRRPRSLWASTASSNYAGTLSIGHDTYQILCFVIFHKSKNRIATLPVSLSFCMELANLLVRHQPPPIVMCVYYHGRKPNLTTLRPCGHSVDPPSTSPRNDSKETQRNAHAALECYFYRPRSWRCHGNRRNISKSQSVSKPVPRLRRPSNGNGN